MNQTIKFSLILSLGFLALPFFASAASLSNLSPSTINTNTLFSVTVTKDNTGQSVRIGIPGIIGYAAACNDITTISCPVSFSAIPTTGTYTISLIDSSGGELTSLPITVGDASTATATPSATTIPSATTAPSATTIPSATTAPSATSTSCAYDDGGTLVSGSNNKNFETPHNYSNNMICGPTAVFTCPAGTNPKLWFQKFETQSGHDGLLVLKADDSNIEGLSGTIAQGFTRLYTESNSIKLKFTSDDAITGWGVNMDYIDCKVPPAGTISINNGDNFTSSTSVTLTLTCAITGGCSKMKISNASDLAGATEENFATSKSWTLLSTGANTTRAVYVKFKDAEGDWSSTYPDTIELDTIAPTISAFDASATGLTITSTWTAADNAKGSGIGHYELWRAPNVRDSVRGDIAGTWVCIIGEGDCTTKRNANSGETDTPGVGKWWYGLHAIDNASNCIAESTNHCGGVSSDPLGSAARTATGPDMVVVATPLIATQLPDADFSFNPASFTTNGTATSATTTVSGSLKTNLNIGIPNKTVSLLCFNGSTDVPAGNVDGTNASGTTDINGSVSFSWRPSSSWHGDVLCHLSFAEGLGYAASTNSDKTVSITYDNIAPTISAFDASATGLTITSTWTAADNAEGSGIGHYELWRAPNVRDSVRGDIAGTWVCIIGEGDCTTKRNANSGETDTPGVGKWWYGLHAIDNASNCIAESTNHCGGVSSDPLGSAARTATGPDMVVVAPACTGTPTLTITPSTIVQNSSTPVTFQVSGLSSDCQNKIATVYVTTGGSWQDTCTLNNTGSCSFSSTTFSSGFPTSTQQFIAKVDLNGSGIIESGELSRSANLIISSCLKTTVTPFPTPADTFQVTVPTSSGTKQCTIKVTYQGKDLSDITTPGDNGIVSQETRSSTTSSRTIGLSDNPPSSCTNNLIYDTTSIQRSTGVLGISSVAESKSAAHDLSFGYALNTAGSGCVVKNIPASSNCADDGASSGEHACALPTLSSNNTVATKNHGIKNNYSTVPSWGGVHSAFDFNLVECNQNSDCTADPTKTVCNTTNNTCVAPAADNPPTITIGTSSGQWFNANPTLNTTYSDDHGFTATSASYKIGTTGTWTQITSDGSTPISLSGIIYSTNWQIKTTDWNTLPQGPTTIYLSVTDTKPQTTGLDNSKSLVVNKDTIAPISTIYDSSATPGVGFRSSDSTYWFGKSTSYSIPTADLDIGDLSSPPTGSGIDETQCSYTITDLGRSGGPVTRNETRTCNGNVTITVGPTGDCQTETERKCLLTIMSKDNANNPNDTTASTSFKYLNIDYTPPTAR